VASRGSRTSPRWPGHKQEVAMAGTGSLKVEDKGADLQKAPWLWGFF
jgi:hypothetical protein